LEVVFPQLPLVLLTDLRLAALGFHWALLGALPLKVPDPSHCANRLADRFSEPWGDRLKRGEFALTIYGRLRQYACGAADFVLQPDLVGTVGQHPKRLDGMATRRDCVGHFLLHSSCR
jgi:hypothetical protein